MGADPGGRPAQYGEEIATVGLDPDGPFGVYPGIEAAVAPFDQRGDVSKGGMHRFGRSLAR